MKKWVLASLFAFGVLTLILLFIPIIPKKPSSPSSAPAPSPTIAVPTPKIYQPIDQYLPPVVPTSSSYTLIFVGDSMTESLGENFDKLRINLKKYYPDKIFGLFNYGFGSTNVLSVEDRLNHDIVYLGRNMPAILGRSFDIIFIESFGNNPLSEFALDVGLQKQTAALDHLVAEIAGTHPNSLIVFIATIAPSQAFYGKGVVTLSPLVRNQWANERRAYIENHINYAKRHNIPLINVYEKTLDKNGLTITKYLDQGNYIHPSAEGVSLISQMIADFLYKNLILKN